MAPMCWPEHPDFVNDAERDAWRAMKRQLRASSVSTWDDAMATSLRERLAQALAAGLTSPRAVLAAIAASDPGAVEEISEAELVAVDPDPGHRSAPAG